MTPSSRAQLKSFCFGQGIATLLDVHDHQTTCKKVKVTWRLRHWSKLRSAWHWKGKANGEAFVTSALKLQRRSTLLLFLSGKPSGGHQIDFYLLINWFWFPSLYMNCVVKSWNLRLGIIEQFGLRQQVEILHEIFVDFEVVLVRQ
jgi:hypothetical protein